MKKLSKKERKVIQNEIANEVIARYEDLQDVDEIASKELLDSIMELLKDRDEPYYIVLATLKSIVCGIHFFEILEEVGIDVEEKL